MRASPTDLSIVIPVHHGGEMFRQCLAGVALLSPGPREVVVVVDGDDPGSAATADGAVAAGVVSRVLRLPRRSGPAAARNAGAAAAGGGLLLFLDADVVPASDLVGRIVSVFAADPGLGALIGSYDDEPGACGLLSQYRNLLHHYVHQTGAAEAFTFWGACGAIRRDTFERLGGFDPDIPEPAMEDIELGQRLVQAGERIALRKEIQVKHLKPWTALGLLRTDIFQRALPWSRFLRRQGALPNDLNLKRGARASAVLAWLLPITLALLPRQPWFGLAAAGCGAGLLALNLGFYRFLMRKRGIGFTLASVPWHWLYFLYASAAYAYVVGVDGLRERLRRVRARWRGPTVDG